MGRLGFLVFRGTRVDGLIRGLSSGSSSGSGGRLTVASEVAGAPRSWWWRMFGCEEQVVRARMSSICLRLGLGEHGVKAVVEVVAMSVAVGGGGEVTGCQDGGGGSGSKVAR